MHAGWKILLIGFFLLKVQSLDGRTLGSKRTTIETFVFLGANKLVPVQMDIRNGDMKSLIKPYSGAGLNIGYMFNERIGLYTGAGMSKYQYVAEPQNKIKGDILRLEGSISMIEVPLAFRYSIPGNNFDVCVNIGAKAAFLLKGQMDYNFALQIFRNEYKETIDQKKDGVNLYNMPAILPFINFNVAIPIGQTLYLTLGPEVSYQVSNLFNYSYLSYGASDYLNIPGGHAGLEKWKGNYLNISIKAGIGLSMQ